MAALNKGASKLKEKSLGKPMKKTLLQIPAALAVLVSLTGFSSLYAAEAGNVNDQRIIDATEAEPGNWLSYGQTYKEQRFSQLTQINNNNVDELNLAWSKPIGD